MNENKRIFICFSAKDRYDIVEPLVYHLKNYGIELWYDRHKLVMGDNRVEKNLMEGAKSSEYSLIILSKNTITSVCAMEEIKIVKKKYYDQGSTIFPILYEISPNELPHELEWVRELIFKEVKRSSGTREICNHIACKITEDILTQFDLRCVSDFITVQKFPWDTRAILKSYLEIDAQNLNSRISLLYAAYLTITCSKDFSDNTYYYMIIKIFERLINELNLNLNIDYRELWLLENTLCILGNLYLSSCIESKI